MYFCYNKLVLIIASCCVLFTLMGHTDKIPISTITYPYIISTVEFSHDNSMVYIGQSLWNSYTGTKIFDFETSNGVAFSLDDKLLVTSSCNGFLQATIWDIDEGVEIISLQAVNKPKKDPLFYKSFIFTSDQAKLIAAEYYGEIHLWDIDSGTMKVIGSGSHLDQLFITKDGSKLFAMDKIISLITYDTLEYFNEGTIRLTSDGETMFLAQNGYFTFYDVNTMEIIDKIPYQPIYNTAGRISPDGMFIMAGKNETSSEPTRLIDLRSQKSVQNFTTAEGVKAENAPPISLIRFSPDGKLVAAASEKTVYIYDISDLTAGARNAESLNP